MCGRYTVSNPGEVLGDLLEGAPFTPVEARFNVAPTQDAPVIVSDEHGRRELRSMRWGLVPFWAESLDGGARAINARSETVAEKPTFRESFARRRCLVAADGFYEWQKVPGGKQPYHLRLPDGGPIAFAGVWDRWRGPRGRVVESFSILTTTPHPVVEPIHDRMPVFLAPEARPIWIDRETATEALHALLGPWRGELEAVPVSDRVNSPANDSLECLQPVLPPPQQSSLFE